jgi:hypothetical protein
MTDSKLYEDDTALLTTALNHTWAWYDGWTNRAFQVANYYFLASAILGAAYTSAITKNHGLAAGIAIGQTGLTALASLAWSHETKAAASAQPALAHLQKRMASSLNMPSVHLARPHEPKRWRTLVRSGFGLSVLLSVSGLIYALTL